MQKYNLVAMGGTFDVIHKGHMALLRRAFELSNSVIIGVTSDQFVAKLGKKIQNDYDTRVMNLKKALQTSFPNRTCYIKQLNEEFGPALYTKDVQALIVSTETQRKGAILNEQRAQQGLPPVDVLTVELVLASDGKRISSTRIRNGEIDTEGNLLK
ncbi:MAG: phosphopantetheine adenylyltransferase [Nitrososphaerales archaeon]